MNLIQKLENGVVLSIKDFGIGIDEEDISRVFDKDLQGKMEEINCISLLEWGCIL